MANGLDITTITSVLSVTTFIIGILLGVIIKRAIKLALGIVALVALLARLEHALSEYNLLRLQRGTASSLTSDRTGHLVTNILSHISSRVRNRTLERLTPSTDKPRRRVRRVAAGVTESRQADEGLILL